MTTQNYTLATSQAGPDSPIQNKRQASVASVAVAMLAVAAGFTLPTAAHAQSSVTLYGLLDLSLDWSHSGSQSTYRMLSGAQTGSRFGLKGSEDIGGGNRINFTLENGFNLNNGTASDSTSIFNRQAWVGASGRWGEVRFGRQNSPLYVPLEGKFDATGASTIASGLNSFATLSVRASNALYYGTPDIAGFSAQAMLGLRDNTTTPRSGINNYHLTASYTRGPVDLGVGYQSVDSATNASTLKAFFGGGSYDFGTVRLYAGFHHAQQSDGSVDKNVYTVSGAYRFNPASTLALVYSHLDDRTPAARDADHLGLMYAYWLSKRTWLYASGAVLLNKGTSAYALAGSTTPGVAVAYPGADAQGVQIGVQHRF
ncbi:Outer membrane porin protein 32 [Pandoraea iniqua]|uniref:Outer membrane porin protein 32 n=1 Tax=Pandoraea iniqua TaxID=2508288 RepID=A0A5E4XE76_9BURK|nr:porin [Pandoraea iniqua]VVE34460.1 Outer membrane porin protein 32 [Pandoraea iniqua]